MEGRKNKACILGQYSCHIADHEEIRRIYSKYDFCEFTKIKVSRMYNNGRSSNVAILRFWSFHDISTMEYVGVQ
jgi:N6-adenosine-specific RNA methylase IME4